MAVFLSILLVLLTASFVLGVFIGAPFIPTSQRKMLKMLELAKLKKGETLVDLGAGDGRFVLAVAKQGFQAVGVELNPFQVAWCRLRIASAGLSKKATIVQGSIFDYELRKADVVICYLFPETNKKLQPKLERELKPGARVLTHSFSLPGWKPTAHDPQERIYVYTMGRLRK